ncbi:MAG TPA: tetratricopeptide repeat protein [Candidatus Sulfomarinibacteraceae bacterium]|nr:tetratricopeptide repeat protein [Candidatus Sulfomarinibacteraceae bacterium]
MDRRWNLLFAVPLLAALVAYLLTNQLLFTALGFVVGYLVMEGLRFLLLPPHLHSAVRLYRRGALEEALSRAEESIAAKPERWESHYLRALILFGMSRLEAAEESARRATQLNSESDINHLTVGQILYAQGRFEEAEEAFSEAVRVKGREGVNHYHLASAHYRLERYADAAPRLELATRLGLENPQLELLAHYYLARSLQQLGHEEAAHAAYQEMQKHAEALEALQKDVQNVPDYPERALLQQDITAINSHLSRMA